MRFDIITIFPDIFDSYLGRSIIKRAIEKKLVKIKIHNLRDFAKDKYRRVDDKPYGGGAGMVMMAEPILKSVSSIKYQVSKKTKIILTSVRGRQFTQAMARQWAGNYKQIIIICGHYEGVDERVKTALKAEEVSIGDYILTGGELPAMVITDAVSRHIPGVLGKYESLEEIKGSYPVFTRPEIFLWPPSRRGKRARKYRVPKILLSGDHKRIKEWRSAKQRRRWRDS